MKMDLISVIIPAYNVEEYIKRCLDSVCTQSYRELEIIIIDDGSTDQTAQICDEDAACDNRIKVVHKMNAGVASARNDALDMATGSMIAFCDADDHYEPDMLERLYDAMKKYGADMACCGYYEEYPDHIEERKVGPGLTEYDKQQAYEEFFRMSGRIGSGCWNKLVKTCAFEGIRFKQYVMGEDVELLSRIIDRCSKVVCIDHAGYHYVHRNGSATQNAFRPENMNIIHVVDDMEGYIRDKHPELLYSFYGFHAAWYLSVLLVMRRSGHMNRYRDEQAEFRKRIRKNMKHYRHNAFVDMIDRILLESFLLHCFAQVYNAFEFLSKIKRRLTDKRFTPSPENRDL